jgi:hypothetical protein
VSDICAIILCSQKLSANKYNSVIDNLKEIREVIKLSFNVVPGSMGVIDGEVIQRTQHSLTGHNTHMCKQ